jgi:hypothetical protein
MSVRRWQRSDLYGLKNFAVLLHYAGDNREIAERVEALPPASRMVWTWSLFASGFNETFRYLPAFAFFLFLGSRRLEFRSLQPDFFHHLDHNLFGSFRMLFEKLLRRLTALTNSFATE